MRQVDEIREFFDNYERNMNELWTRFDSIGDNKTHGLSDNMKASSKSAENLKFNKQNNFVSGICQQNENQSCRTLSSSTSNLLHIIASGSPRSASVSRCPPSSPSPRKCFYLPEEKIHSNELLVKIRQHFDKSHDKQRHSNGICNVDSASNQNKIAKTKNHKSASVMERQRQSSEYDCKNDGDLTSAPLFNEDKNERDQKIFQLNESDSSATMSTPMDSFKINESAATIFHQQPLPLEEPLCYRVSKQKQQQSALIKNDNAISCGVGNDFKLETRGNATISSYSTTTSHHHAISNELSGVIAVGDEKQKHYHCKDLKPIKSLELATTKTRSTAVARENEIADDGKQHQEQEPLAKLRKQQQQFYQKQVYDERYNSILMNDDCKLQQQQKQQQMQDEQTSSSSDGTCRDKYFKDSKVERLLKNDLRINEISTNNSTSGKNSCRESGKINSIRNNLNLDLFFDKELSAWTSVMGKRTDNEIPITEIQMRSSNDFESNSCTKLDNETMANYGCNSESTSDSSDDCTSTTSSSSDSHIITTRSSYNHQTTNSAYPSPPHTSMSVDDNNSIKTEATRNSKRLFTDGTYIYGPYDFDLFTNSFYQFRDIEHENEEEKTNAGDNDEASFLQHHDKRNRINIELLKNHDDINTQASSTAGGKEEVPCVRDMDPTDEIPFGKCNDNVLNDRVILNATNYSKDDERDFPKWKNDKNFNYSPSSKEACDRNLIDLMDGGDSYVSKIRDKDDRDLHRPTLTDYVDAASMALLLTAITVDAADLNNSEQFNYERDKIVEITDDDDALATIGGGGDGEKHEILSTSHIAGAAQCTTAVNEKFSNHKVPKIKILGCDGNCVDSVGRDSAEDEIRFRECERRGMCDKFYSSVNYNCHGNDNIAEDECQG